MQEYEEQKFSFSFKVANDDSKSESKKWKYLINMSGNQFPLRTNYELVKILKIYNGYNDININKNDKSRYAPYKHVYDPEQNRVVQTNVTNDPPPHNFTIMKGYTNCVISREFTQFVLTNKYVKDLIVWSENMWVSDEM